MIGDQNIECQMMFDVKPDLTRNARHVAVGHLTETSSSLTNQGAEGGSHCRIFLVFVQNGNAKKSAASQNVYQRRCSRCTCCQNQTNHCPHNHNFPPYVLRQKFGSNPRVRVRALSDLTSSSIQNRNGVF
jgi:hypothetical protein